MADDPNQLVTQVLKDSDRDRYLASLVLKEPFRSHIQAVLAFNCEIASIRERITEPNAGEIRLQWWVELLENQGRGDVAANPVAAALLEVVAAYRLPVAPLLGMLNARRFDLYDDPMRDMASFEGYAGETNSVLYQFAAMILNDGTAIETGDAAGHLGVAHALIGQMRSLGHTAARGQIYLPWAEMVQAGVREADLFAGRGSPELATALHGFCDQARGHLDKAEAAIAALPVTVRPAFAQIAILRRQNDKVSRSAALWPAKVPDASDWRKLLALMIWSLRRG